MSEQEQPSGVMPRPPPWAIAVIGVALALAVTSLKEAHDANSEIRTLSERVTNLSRTVAEQREELQHRTRDRFTAQDWQARQQWLEEVLRNIDRRLSAAENRLNGSKPSRASKRFDLYSFKPQTGD